MGAGERQQASPALPQHTKAPCFPPVPRRGWSCSARARQAPLRRQPWATTNSSQASAVLCASALWVGAAAAAARPAHTGTPRENSHHIPRFPRALLLPPQPFLVLGMSVRGGRRCQSHGTGLAKHCHFSCKSKQLLQSSWWVLSEQCYDEQHPPAGHNGPQKPSTSWHLSVPLRTSVPPALLPPPPQEIPGAAKATALPPTLQTSSAGHFKSHNCLFLLGPPAPTATSALSGTRQQGNTQDKQQFRGTLAHSTKWHREGCHTSCNLPPASAATGINDVCPCRGGKEALPGILLAKSHPQASWSL